MGRPAFFLPPDAGTSRAVHTPSSASRQPLENKALLLSQIFAGVSLTCVCIVVPGIKSNKLNIWWFDPELVWEG